MKYFIITHLISVSFLVCVIISYEFLPSFSLFKWGLVISFIITIVLTKFLARERWITILYTFINFLIDTCILYVIFYIISLSDGLGNSTLGLALLLLYPFLTIMLLLGSLIGVVLSIYSNIKEED